MALRTQELPIPLLGLDQSRDERWNEAGQAAVLENVVVRRQGRLQKRKGLDPLTTTGMPTSPHTLVSSDQHVMCFGRDGARWIDGVTWRECSGRALSVFGSPSDVNVKGIADYSLAKPEDFMCDGISHNGYRLVCWVDDQELSTTNSGYEVQDAVTGRVILSGSDTYKVQKVSKAGDYVVLFQGRNVTSSLTALVFDFSAEPTSPTSRTLALNLDTNQDFHIFDPFLYTDTEIGLTYTDATPRARVATFTPSSGATSIKSDGTKSASTSGQMVTGAYNADLDRVAVSYRANSTDVRFTSYDFSTNLWTASTTPTSQGFPLQLGVVSYDANEWWFVIDWDNGSDQSECRVYRGVDASPISVTSGRLVYGRLTTRPFMNNGIAYAGFGVGDEITSPEAIVSLESAGSTRLEVVANYGNLSNASRRPPGFLAHVGTDGFRHTFTYPRKIYTQFAGSSSVQSESQFSIHEYTWDASPTSPLAKLSVRHGALVGAGNLVWADIQDAREHADVFAPVLLYGRQASSGDASLVSGSLYLVAARSFWADRKGNIHYSPTSEIERFFASSTDSTAGLTHTYLQPGPGEAMEVFRSQANESTLNRAGLLVTGSLQSVTDDKDNDGLLNNETLATSELNPAVPQVITSLASAGERLWALAEGRVWFSKILVDGRAVEFNAGLVLQMGNADSSPTAVADQDGVPIVFTETEIYAVSGLGPNNNGLEGSFEPQRLTADTGCVSSRSVVSTPLGIMFQSPEGFRLLDRSNAISRLETGYWGSQVADFASATVVASVVRERTNEVVWALDSATTPNNEDALIYNYEWNVWSTASYSLGTTVRDLEVGEDDTLYVLAADGVVHAEQSDFLDDGTAVSQVLETSWISAARLAGWQRVKRITLDLKFAEDVGITVEAKVDDASSFTTISQWTEAEISALGRPDQLRCAIPLSLQKSSRIRFRITEQATSPTTGEGFQLIGMRIEVGVKKGHAKVNAGARK